MLVDMNALAVRGFGNIEIHEVGEVGYEVLAIPTTTRPQTVPEENAVGRASVGLIKQVLGHGWFEIDSAPKG